jgi:hypothetical protein
MTDSNASTNLLPDDSAPVHQVEWKSDLLPWQQTLMARLETGLGRALARADLPCIVWNAAAETLTVQNAPLLGEVRARNLTSNVFRYRYQRR